MSFRKIIDSVPAFYEPLLPQVFQTEIPPEPFSDCLNCPMIDTPGEDPGSNLSKPFSPYTKCCTFTPRLPNYLAGAILTDNDPAMQEGRKRLSDTIMSGQGIFPNGVYPTLEYHRSYIERSRKEFGRARDLRCPYFTEGRYNCTIWKYRETICALWFCQHLAGTRGREFWDAVIDYMKFMQESLINMSAYMCGLQPVDPYGEGGRPEYHEPEDPAEARKKRAELWKEWVGHETEYYIKCHEIIINLEHDHILKIHEKGASLAKKIKSIASEIIKLPEYLVLNKDLAHASGEGYYQVELRNYIEILQKQIIWSFRLPKLILDPFDGKSGTTEVLRQIAVNEKIKVEPEILIALCRHGVLAEKKLDL
ncbi:MAG: hypothetical protein LC649_02825 [Bacteroidales bacterium]|nr:hypothetical protein [Bacteroidales bacterium]